MSVQAHVVAAAAEIVSAAAVVISLGLLIVSVRENTAVLRATAAAESRDSLADQTDLDLTLGDEHIRLLMRSNNPTSKLEDFTALEMNHLRLSQRGFFRRAEAQYFRYRNGLLDDDAWQTVRHRVWRNIQSPVTKAIWTGDRAEIYTPGFVDSIESYTPVGLERSP